MRPISLVSILLSPVVDNCLTRLPLISGPLIYRLIVVYVVTLVMATALLRLASIRLFTDLSPSRTLETRNAAQIAVSFGEAPYLIRSARLNKAILQAIHALSMLVKLGVNYVARRKSAEWSMQHSREYVESPLCF